MNFNAKENLKQVNESLSVEMLQQQKRLYNVAGIKKQYSEPVPNNYSFILFYGEEGIFDKINKQAELYKPLNNLNQRLYDYYSQLNINKCSFEKLMTCWSLD